MKLNQQFERTARIIGENGVQKLMQSRVLIFGVGGVGSYVAEGLARSGIGAITLVDKDCVDITNINRQIPALYSTIGRPKVEVMAERIKDINPECSVCTHEIFFLPERNNEQACRNETNIDFAGPDIDFASYDYVVDAVDTVSAKIYIIECSREAKVPVISSMGTGNKIDAGQFKITTIEKTKVCPLAKVMRRELKQRGIEGVKVLYSEEEPASTDTGHKTTGGSISFVPSVAGLLIAGEVVKDLLH